MLLVVRHADADDKRTCRGPVEPLGRDRLLRIESVPALGVDTSPAE
jgi:hypothetical protein